MMTDIRINSLYRHLGLAALIALACNFSAQSANAAPRGGAGQAGGEQAAAASAGAGATVGDNDPEAVNLLRQLEAKYGNVNTVAGTFRQSNKEEGPMAKKTPLEMAAWFYMQKPNKFRVDYQYVKKAAAGQASAAASNYPYDSTNLVVGNVAQQYVRDLDQVSTYKLGRGNNVRDLNYLLLGFGAHTDEVLRVYKVTSAKSSGNHRTLVLTPRNPTDAGFKRITMSVTNDENLLPSQFTLEHNDAGTSSRITVTMDPSSLRMGGQIPSDTFNDRFPTKNKIALN